MAHLYIRLAHLQVVKMNVALYDYLCDVIDVVNRHTRFWLEDTRGDFMTDALQYIHASGGLAAVLESDIRVHKRRLVQEIDRNRELRRHVNAVKQYWYSKWKDGAVVPGCSSSAIYRCCRTDVNKDLPVTMPVTELCNQLLRTYYYKYDSTVVDALPLLMTSDDRPAPRECLPVTEQPDAGVRRRSPVREQKQPISVRLLALSSTLTPGGDKDVFDLPATTTPEPDVDSRSRLPDATTAHAPCTVLGGTDPAARGHQQEATKMEEKRQKMSQWLIDQASSIQDRECRKRKASMMDKLLPPVKHQRTTERGASLEPPRTTLKLSRKQNLWAVDNRGARSDYKRHS